MKSLIGPFLKLSSPVIIVLSTFLTFFIGGAVGYFLIVPAFNKLSATAAEGNVQKQNLSEINRSITFLSNQDKSSLVVEKNFLDSLIPDQVNIIHFASLNEIVSAAAGVSVKTIQLSQGVSKTTASGSTTTSTTGQTSQNASDNVTVTYSSGFDSLLTLIKYWRAADQLVGITKVNINADTTGVLNYTVTYELPTATQSTKATITDRVSLTAVQKDAIDKLKDTILYIATPSANPIGKDNPFK